jgi:aldose 1-epimerase
MVQLPAGLKVPRSPSSPAGIAVLAGATTPGAPGHAGTGRMAGMTELMLTGEQYGLRAGDYEAAVTGLGAGLRLLTHGGRALITSYRPDELPPSGAGQLLAPWPNRVDGGRYEFGGRSCQLDLSEPANGNAIHGLTRWATWTPAGQSESAVTLRHVLLGSPGYPFCLELAASYELDAGTGLQLTVTARNAGPVPAPYGTGSHPYLTAGPPLIDECELQLPAARRLPADERGIPSGEPSDVTGTPLDFRQSRPIGRLSADDALTGLARDEAGRAWARLAGPELTVALWAGPGYDWLQVFTGDALSPARRRRALAIEPMTCPANAFVTGTGLLTLQPGGTVSHSWGIRVLP